MFPASFLRLLTSWYHFRVPRVEWKVLEVCECAGLSYALLITTIARRLLKSLSIKQGLKYDDPASARDIKPFIDFHRLKIEEIRDPIESFSQLCS